MNTVIQFLITIAGPVVAMALGLTFLVSFALTIRPSSHAEALSTRRRLFSIKTMDAVGWVTVVVFMEFTVLLGFRAIRDEATLFLVVRGLLQVGILAALVVRLIHWRRLQRDVIAEKNRLRLKEAS